MSHAAATTDTFDLDLDGDTLREECGVFGIFGHPDASAIVALGLHALQHRGQEAAGIVSFDGSVFHSERRPGLVGDSFSDGDTIAPKINALAASGDYDLVIATRDWHPADHNSFKDQGGIWPVHCVAGTQGAQLHPDLDRTKIDIVVDKGQAVDTNGYSGFEGTDLDEILRERGITQVTVVGLATDYCVKNTALDALKAGFQVTVDSTAARGVEVEPGDSRRALEEVRAAGGVIA